MKVRSEAAKNADTTEKVNKAAMLASYLYAAPSVSERLWLEGNGRKNDNRFKALSTNVEGLEKAIEKE